MGRSSAKPKFAGITPREIHLPSTSGNADETITIDPPIKDGERVVLVQHEDGDEVTCPVCTAEVTVLTTEAIAELRKAANGPRSGFTIGADVAMVVKRKHVIALLDENARLAAEVERLTTWTNDSP